MAINQKPAEIWKEHTAGVDYKTAINLFENVRVNENFYIGRQWEGVNAPDLPKPVLNFLKRVVTYSVAMVVSDDVAVSFSPFMPDPRIASINTLIAEQVERIIEQTDAKTMHRKKVRDAAVDGDGLVFLWFDTDIETGQDSKGETRIESIENINLHPGNPYIHSIQEQPWIIVSKRVMLNEVKEEARTNGMDEAEINNITPDSDSNQGEKGNDSNSLVTVLMKFWRETVKDADGTIRKTIFCVKTTEKAVVKEAWDTGLRYYPIASMRWEEVKSQFFGNAMLNGMIQNQISVNRLFAMMIRSVEMMAFPKVIYKRSAFPKGYSNKVGEAVAAEGDVDERVATSIRGGDVSNQVMEVIESVITMTRDFMGANDAALGNVKADNTSAIIAVQQASAVPLELQRREFYRFVEEYVRIIVDMMRANYGTRKVMVDDPDLIKVLIPEESQIEGVTAYPIDIDFGEMLKDANMQMKVDVGASAYWSELMNNQVMDNLFVKGILKDAELFVESIPSHMLPNKNKILAEIRKQKEAAQKQGELQAELERQEMEKNKSPQDMPLPNAALQ